VLTISSSPSSSRRPPHSFPTRRSSDLQAPALTVEQLRSMLESTEQEGIRGLRDRALLLLGYAMMARRGELAALDITDVRLVEEGLEVCVATSKTEQDAHGVTGGVA